MGTSDESSSQGGSSSTSLKPNVAGLLCYVGMWVTGIIFLIIEKKNKEVRFHAMQSIVVFGIFHIILAIIAAVIGGIAWGWGWGYGFGIGAAYLAGWVIYVLVQVCMWILYIVLLIRAYRGHIWKVPLGLGNLAEKMLAKLDSGK